MNSQQFEYETIHKAARESLENISPDVGGLSETQIGVYAHVAAILMSKAAHQGAEDYLNGRAAPLSPEELSDLRLGISSGTRFEKQVETALGAQAMSSGSVGMKIAHWVHSHYQRARTAAGEQMLTSAP